MDSRPPLATGSRMRRTRCLPHFYGSSFGAEGTYGSEVERIDPDVARRRLAELDWWHTIEIAPGVVTPGGWDLRASGRACRGRRRSTGCAASTSEPWTASGPSS